MKLYFKVGIQFIFSYTSAVNITGPVYAWQVASEYNQYLAYLHDDTSLMKWGSGYGGYNLKQFKKFMKFRKL